MNIVKLIGTNWCAPCKLVKQLLDDKGLGYDYLDGDTEEGMAEAQAIGARSFPILFVNESVFVGDKAVQATKGLPNA